MLIDGPALMPSIGESSLGCSSDMEKSDPDVFGEWSDKDKEKDKDDDDWDKDDYDDDKAKMKYKNMIRKARYGTMLKCMQGHLQKIIYLKVHGRCCGLRLRLLVFHG